MRKRTSWKATGSLVGAGLMAFAGGPGESVAQTRADSNQERLSLSAAIEEARRSPFYAWAAETESREGPTTGALTDAMAASHLLLPQPMKDPFVAPPFGITLALAELSHLGATALLLMCAYANGFESDSVCLLIPAITIPVVALPARGAGVDWGRALGASAIGLAGGVGAFVATIAVTENANPIVAGAVSGLVHAAITTIMVRQR